MAKDDTKARLIAEGARLIHEKGFNHTGIQEILRAAGVPKGSFYFYFETKEQFGLAVIDYFSQYMATKLDSHLSNSALPHLTRLKGFFDGLVEYFRNEGCSRGCPFGNLAQELSDLNDTFRKKLNAAFDMYQAKIAACLQAAIDANEISNDLDPHEAAYFILNSWEGALTRMKTEKSLEPLIVFDKIVFGRLLCTPGEKDPPRP